MKSSIKLFLQLTIVAVFTISSVILQAQVTQEWVQIYGGPLAQDHAAEYIVVDAYGNVYVAGISGSRAGNNYLIIKYNSSGVEQWVQSYDGPTDTLDNDVPRSIAVDASGNVYVTGQSVGDDYYDDCVTIKYNSSGIEQWVKIYNSGVNINDVGSSIALDGSGNIFVTGLGGVSRDYITIKYNSAGEQQWLKHYNGTGNSIDFASSIKLDVSGNIYVTGSSFGAGTDIDYATVKYDASGNEQWVRRYDGTGSGYDYPRDMDVDGSGNMCITGYSEGIGTGNDYATIKYNSSGDLQWVQRYKTPASILFKDDYGYSVAFDLSGNVYVTGASGGSDVFNDFDYATIKYNSSGVEEWVKRYNGTGNYSDIARSLKIDASGNTYVTGSSYNASWSTDCITIKYNSAGDEEWLERYNGLANNIDEARSIAVDGSGNVYITGFTARDELYEDVVTIKYSQDAPLPVELTSFNSAITGNDVKLNWSTSSEQNNSGFDVERLDARHETQDDWKKIANISGNGTTSSSSNYVFTDKNISSGKYKYRLKQIDFNGNFEYFNLSNEVEIGEPEKFELSQNYPNPFNPVTNLEFGISNLGFVSLKVYDTNGREVSTLVNEIKAAGYYLVTMDGSNLSSGVYFYKLIVKSNGNDFVAMKKMMLIK